MKLVDLEAVSESRHVYSLNLPPPKLRDKTKLLSHEIASTKVLFNHLGKRVHLELWTVVGSQALVLAGPRVWRRDGQNWFCRCDQDLCDYVINQTDHAWDPGLWNKGDIAKSLDQMCSRIVRAPHVPRPKPPVSPRTIPFYSEIELA